MQATLQPYLVSEEQGSDYWFFGSLLTVKLADSTGVSWVEQLVPPGNGSPYHIHNAEDEIFYVLEGEMSFVSGERAWKAGPGTVIFLPRGIPHGFRTEGNQPSRSILITTSDDFGGFVCELGEPATTHTIPEPGPVDMGKVLALAAKYQLQILGPLPDYTV